ncbi:hypothetical protein SLE2022_267940 [Rubroshorea leprosula]
MTVKKTSSRDETEMVEVQGTTEAESSSHLPRKRCWKTKVVKASSDQLQTGGPMVGVVETSSHQTKKRGRKATLTPGEKDARKKACDKKRYYNTKDMLQETREMKPQLEILKNKNAELDSQMGKVNSELLPAITQDMKTMKEDFAINFKNMESLMNKFLQREIKENDLRNMQIPMDYPYLEGEENRLMVLALSEHSNGINDLPTNKLITQGTGSSQTGMSEQHFKQILDELGKITNSNKELISENKKLNSKVNVLDYKVNALTQDIETLKKNDKNLMMNSDYPQNIFDLQRRIEGKQQRIDSGERGAQIFVYCSDLGDEDTERKLIRNQVVLLLKRPIRPS